ncbi:uncharacterized protein LOC122382646 isoform X1 [Amphibalanus amphitrite]|uniref:uncharacterized protein LOC122382646 isoform X1 n=1 Tax=Amphibalanus amphitrite TaxID=1232801 RepID=UPI001C92A79D|nr:uncharacterized protein LOC122382646 isoform X1 [Amphibalanus amphitrite]
MAERRGCRYLAPLLLLAAVSTVTAIDLVDVGEAGRVVIDSGKSVRLHKRQAVRTGPLRPAVEIPPIPAGPRFTMPHISFRELSRDVADAVAAVDQRFDVIEPAIYNSGSRLVPGTPAWFMAASHKIKVVAKNISRIAYIAEEATKHLAEKHKLDKDQITYGLPTADVRGTVLGDSCPVEVDFPCQPRKYRAFNGYCNNVQNPKWGNSNTRYLRFLPAAYGSDGISVPRQARSGQFLPSARSVTLAVHRDGKTTHRHMNVMAAVFGEFIYHDLSHTPQMAGFIGQRLKCCDVELANFHPECYPILISENDPFYGRLKQRCQEYVRSGVAPRTGCTLGPREQINQVTSFLDGSVIYGSSKEENDEIRQFKKGQLKMQQGPSGSKGLLSADPTQLDCKAHPSLSCFRSGDVRVNEHAALATMHTLFAREHNRVALALAEMNRHWTDEQLFQEARRVVGAELQHITYNEFLPVVLGSGIVSKYGLEAEKAGYFTGYDINIDPGVANSVATAALRFVASMMGSSIALRNGDRVTGELDLTRTFYAPFDLYAKGKMDQVLEGLVHEKAMAEDVFISEAMTNKLFEDSADGFGLDLAAQLIQQGRDHGVAGYNEWRKFCGLERAKSFRDLTDTMEASVIEALQRVYNHVDDIDLFTGGLAETANIGALVGPTFGCLIGRQFHYLKRGDRYWYENDVPPSSFSRDQLAEIRKTSLARIICDNADAIEFMQPTVLLQTDEFLNARMDCSKDMIGRVNLDRWRQLSPNFVVPDEMLHESIERAKRDLGEMRHTEWNLHEHPAPELLRALVRRPRQAGDADSRVFQEALALLFDSVEVGQAAWSTLRHHEEKLYNDHLAADPKSAIGSAYAFMRPKRQAQDISNTSMVLQFASQRFVNNFLNGNALKDRESGSVAPRDIHELVQVLPNIDVSDVMEIPSVFECDDQTLPCDHTSKFRTATGWCNNLNNPGFGKAVRALNRLVRPHYGDGLMSPRDRSVAGNPLPSPRLISVNIHNDVSAPHVRYNLMVMQWGQFIDHDITFTPVNKGFGDSILDCRRCDSALTIHPECLPIPVPENDPFFPRRNVTSGQLFCLPFTRSMPGQLTLGYREQMNQVTAYVDASHTYGSDKCEQRQLRTFIGGRLNATRHPTRGKDLLPQETAHDNEECKSSSGVCFTGGDTRASEQPGLAVMHTLLMREHNRMVDYLKRINPHWNDEQLFQNGRRILSAVNQHITYNEFLPRVLGWNAINLYGLNLDSEGYFNGYDPYCDASILNEFATAAFRFGHSLLKPKLVRMDNAYQHTGPDIKLKDTFFNPDPLYEPGMIDQVIRGLATTSMETLDQFITEEVTNHLFEDKKVPFSGLDLVALNLQRGRDHGLAPYNQYRSLCNLTYARDFNDLTREISPPILERLRRTYSSVNDIDLFTGGLAETPLHGGLVGPTFGCIIGIQFRALKRCDRFWYENDDPLVRFTEAQLAEIRKSTLSKMVCDNCDQVDVVQRSLFDLPDPFLNPRVKCDSMKSLDLDLWKERVSCSVGSLTIDIGSAERVSPCVMCTCTKEGPVCQSLKIDNCFHLANSYSPEDILNDHVCKVQCAFAFRALPEVDSHRNQLGFQ